MPSQDRSISALRLLRQRFIVRRHSQHQHRTLDLLVHRRVLLNWSRQTYLVRYGQIIVLLDAIRRFRPTIHAGAAT
jgi:hypothetical protein